MGTAKSLIEKVKLKFTSQGFLIQDNIQTETNNRIRSDEEKTENHTNDIRL